MNGSFPGLENLVTQIGLCSPSPSFLPFSSHLIYLFIYLFIYFFISLFLYFFISGFKRCLSPPILLFFPFSSLFLSPPSLIIKFSPPFLLPLLGNGPLLYGGLSAVFSSMVFFLLLFFLSFSLPFLFLFFRSSFILFLWH